MIQEPQTFARAAGGALLGLGVQAAAGLVLLAMGLLDGNPVALSAAAFAAGGLPAWLCAAMILHQHRLERLEELETARLKERAGSGAGGALFEGSGDELLAAKRRLESLYRWAAPGAGLASAALLAGGGVWLLQRAWAAVGLELAGIESATPWKPTAAPALAVAFTGGLAFVAFLAGRYLGGLARIPGCELLRAGAAHLMAVMLASGALAAGEALAHFDSLTLLRYLALGIPAAMTLAGLETLLNLVLNLYLPRKPGTRPRAAFDSRLLGLLASPEGVAATLHEAINYQFGFEITRSWFWKLLARACLPMAAFGAGALWLLSCLVYVEPHQQAVLLRQGRLVGEPLQPGLHLKAPWPFERADLFDVTGIRQLKAGSHPDLHPDRPVLWTNQHGVGPDELFIVAAPRTGAGAPEGAAGVSVLAAEALVQYRIHDLHAYISGHAEPERRLQAIVWTEAARFFQGLDEDTLLGPERPKAGPRLQARIQQAADAAGLGLEILFAGLAGVHPPQEAADAFHETVRARQEQETALEEAGQQAIRTLAAAAGSVDLAARLLVRIEAAEGLERSGAPPEQAAAETAAAEDLLREAGGEAGKKIAEARAYRWTRENVERGRAERFARELTAQAAAPRVYRMRRYLDVLRENLPAARKYLLLADREKLTLRLDFKDLDLDLPSVDLNAKP